MTLRKMKSYDSIKFSAKTSGSLKIYIDYRQIKNKSQHLFWIEKVAFTESVTKTQWASLQQSFTTKIFNSCRTKIQKPNLKIKWFAGKCHIVISYCDTLIIVGTANTATRGSTSEQVTIKHLERDGTKSFKGHGRSSEAWFRMVV